MSDFIKVKILEIKEEAVGTFSFFFDIPEGMTWQAGSDMHFAHPDFMSGDAPNKDLIRHMSIMTNPEEGRLGFTTRVPGSGSVYKSRLQLLKPGDELVIFKLGNRFPLRRENRPVVLISMGVGVAAVRPMINSWLKDSAGVPSLINIVVDKGDQLIFRKEFESAAAESLINIFSESRNSFYESVESIHFDDEPIFYIVGSDGFLEDVIKRLKARGVSPQSIEIDKKPGRKAEMLETTE